MKVGQPVTPISGNRYWALPNERRIGRVADVLLLDDTTLVVVDFLRAEPMIYRPSELLELPEPPQGEPGDCG